MAKKKLKHYIIDCRNTKFHFFKAIHVPAYDDAEAEEIIKDFILCNPKYRYFEIISVKGTRKDWHKATGYRMDIETAYKRIKFYLKYGRYPNEERG